MKNYIPRQVATLRRDESGSVIIMTILSFPVFLMMIAWVVDTGVWFLDHRLAQTQVDAAALAATIRLPAAYPGNESPATGAVRMWLKKNGSSPGDLSSCPESTPAPDLVVRPGVEYSDRHPLAAPDGLFDTVRVCVRRQSPAIFTLPGVPFVYVDAVATATAVREPTLYSLFANHYCPDSDPILDLPGSISTVTGAVHSNCNLKLSGSNNTFDGPMTYVGDNPISGSGNICNGGPCNPGQTGTVPMPINYTFDDVPCTYTNVTDLTSNSAYWEDPVTMTSLKPGVYCNATGKITLGSGDVEGTVTFVGHEVSLSGSGYNLTPYWNGILLFGTGDSQSAIDASGSNGSWGGAMYAPNGQAKIAGSSGLAIGGSVIADTIVLSGSDVSIVGNIISDGPIPQNYLIE